MHRTLAQTTYSSITSKIGLQLGQDVDKVNKKISTNNDNDDSR